jgi:hypothetical protein
MMCRPPKETEISGQRYENVEVFKYLRLLGNKHRG